MNNTQIINGLIDGDELSSLVKFVTSTDFPWHYLEDTTWENSRKKSHIGTPAFAHLLLGSDGHRSEHLDKFTPIINGLKARIDHEPKNIFRMRLGMLLNTRYSYPSMPYVYNAPHVDAEFPHMTCVYYLNSVDGPTTIFNDTKPPADGERWKIAEQHEPFANQAVLFNGEHYHASMCPKIEKYRLVLTINYTR